MHRVLCFGEVLWDVLPHGFYLGGAPLNVAFHLRQLGLDPVIVSAVGEDALGDEARSAIEASGVDVSAVSRHASWPTGTALVELDAALLLGDDDVEAHGLWSRSRRGHRRVPRPLARGRSRCGPGRSGQALAKAARLRAPTNGRLR